ncbi:hypothetical protein F183_A02330 [Bryobacterales bacterium F-183]|nr:hypothetical protein F183_A02330 [Bryobacterales bacterium F-183]
MSTYLEAVRTIYPGAVSTHDGTAWLLAFLRERFGMEPHQVMFADSLCSDDLNQIEYPKLAFEMLGPFKLGGLNGFPFAGLTGMGAFAHHVPADGAVFAFYGPHIGITKDGTPGKVLRAGQTTPSLCCGAAQGALLKLQRGEIRPGEVTELDYQMNQIEQIFLRQESRILGAEVPIVAATEVMYEATAERIRTLVDHTKYPCRYVVLMGAILINGDHGAGSFACMRNPNILDSQADSCENALEQYWQVARANGAVV